MKNIIKRVPLPLSGVMLGTAVLGNLLQSCGQGFRTVCGLFALFMLILLLLKLVLFPGMFKKDMENPIMAGVSGTFPMALMLLSTYIPGNSLPVWVIAVALHIVLIVYFSVRFLGRFELKNVFTVWYIVYVGIVVASVTAPAYGAQAFGTGVFWFGFVCFLALFVLVTIRYARIPAPAPAKPLISIYAAPLSLCVAGYVQSVTPKSYGFLVTIMVCANLIYIFALVKAVSLLKTPFYPSYAAFTFPFVITAIGTKQTMACAAKLNRPLPALSPIVTIETVIAAVFVIYVFIRFMMAVFRPQQG